VIDWPFIGTLEGRRLSGYVPNPKGSNSGVTIGTGVDLGQIGPAELSALSPSLQAALQPYVGLRGQAAVDFLQGHPLALTGADIDALDGVVDGASVTPLRAAYFKSTDKNFDTLPDACQTVMASVTFQYGTPWLRCPKFWSSCVARDWRMAVAILNDFGDAYSTRRKKEAAYLQHYLDSL
jgi:hypothetical protein